MATLYHQLVINAPASQVFKALSSSEGIGAWWDTPQAGSHDGLRAWLFKPSPEHDVLKMVIDESITDTRILWHCVSQHDASSPASAWANTGIVFELESHEDQTLLSFRHTGWEEANPFMGFCNFQWAMSLKALKQCCENRP